MDLKYFIALLLLPTSWYYLSPIFHPLPKPTGTYQIGTKSYEFFYHASNELPEPTADCNYCGYWSAVKVHVDKHGSVVTH